MSLINQMLRDLEQRRADSQPSAPLTITPLLAPTPSRFRYIGWLLVASMLSIGLLIADSLKPVSQTHVSTEVVTIAKTQPEPSSEPAQQPINTLPVITLAPQPVETTLPTTAPSLATTITEQAIAIVRPASSPIKLSESRAVSTAVKPLVKGPSKQQQTKHPQETFVTQQSIAANQPATPSIKPTESPAPAPLKPAAKPLSDQQQAKLLLQQAQHQHDPNEIERTLQQALALQPTFLEARILLAKTLLQSGNLDRTAAFLDQSLEVFPNDLLLIQSRAQLHLQQKHPAAALAVLQRVKTSTQDATHLSLLAISHQQLGAFAESADIYRKLTILQPDKAEHWLGLGTSLDRLGDAVSAADAFQQALAKNTLRPAIVSYIKQRIGDHIQ